MEVSAPRSHRNEDVGRSHDPDLAYRRFVEDSQRLFSSTANEFERIYWIRARAEEREESMFQSQLVDGSDGNKVDEILKRDQEYEPDIIYIIKQGYSWGPLNTTLFTFRKILEYNRVSSKFLYFVHAFGRKIDDESLSRDGYDLSTSCQSGATISEFCYNIQYFEKNGRLDCPPWSLRQVGVYHQRNSNNSRSRWLLLNPSQYLRARLEETVRHHPYTAVSLHLSLLSATSRNWLEYMEDLHAEIRQLNEKACFSRVGRDCRHDYKITFSDCQKLQRLREKIQRSNLILKSCTEVAKGCVSLSRLVVDFNEKGSESFVQQGIESYSNRIERYQDKLSFLLERCISTTDLTSRILAFRDEELAQRNYQAMRESLEILKHISLQGREENAKLTKVSTQSYKDSRMLKALTIVATMYLPATFLATVFSSNLVQTESKPNGETHMVLASQFWIFVAVALPLMLTTFAFTLWLERIWLRHGHVDL